MEHNGLITKALAHATRAHAGQTDKRGRPLASTIRHQAITGAYR